jgi:hypothetical protein
MNSTTERRENLRLRPKEKTFVALRPEFVKLGKLLDISKRGLCFQYYSKGESIEKSPLLNIDMFISNNGYYLPNIPCRAIYDEKLSKGMKFVMGLEYRRCGLQFDTLSKQQIDQLDLFLNEHAERAQ